MINCRHFRHRCNKRKMPVNMNNINITINSSDETDNDIKSMPSAKTESMMKSALDSKHESDLENEIDVEAENTNKNTSKSKSKSKTDSKKGNNSDN